MKGPYSPFPFVIRIIKDIMWCLRGRIVIKLNKATSTDVKNRSVGSMGSNGSWDPKVIIVIIETCAH